MRVGVMTAACEARKGKFKVREGVNEPALEFHNTLQSMRTQLVFINSCLGDPIFEHMHVVSDFGGAGAGPVTLLPVLVSVPATRTALCFARLLDVRECTWH
eukprot:6185294-Pleurochrysis_carterae.AAC.2